MSEDAHLYTPRQLQAPDDPELAARLVRMSELGLEARPDPELDRLADDIAASAQTGFAMVNFVVEDRQYFAGLHLPSPAQPESALATTASPVGREMDRDHGYCPHVVARKKALVLDDVCDYPRFAGNAVVDGLGVRSYLGAPLVDRKTNTTLGTVCVVDTKPRVWGRPGLELIKHQADEVMRLIERRA